MDLAFQLVSVVVVLGGMTALMWFLGKRRGITPTRTTGGMVVEARLQLTPQHSLHIVQFENHRFVVAAHPSGCSVLLTPKGEAK